MATNTKHLLQHPSHHHPLELLDLTNKIRLPLLCRLCGRRIWTEAYTCQEVCNPYYYHKACAEAPTQIDRHPLHPVHPLTLIQHKRAFECDACGDFFNSGGSSFFCNECDFGLDICCALSSLSDVGVYQGGKTSEQITFPIHPHPLTSFSTRHDFVGDSDCYICRGSVDGDGYMCLRWRCEFVIHKRCIQDLYFADGNKAPRVYHGHPLEILIGEDMGSSTCAGCGSDKSGEFIGCSCCQVFYHKNCFQVPEILQYPSHNPDHTLVLFPDIGTHPPCQSCSSSLEDEIYYPCTSCDFFVHVGCVIQVLAYFEEGMSAKIELSWHKHPLLLCHRTESAWNGCIYCEDESIGPSYLCEEVYCGFLLHKRCTEIESTITHPHHPDHPLTLCERYDDHDPRWHYCKACHGTINGFKFSCQRCLFDLHVECATRFPTHKHYLHEQKLLRFEEHRYSVCNRCGIITDSPLFRCVQCNFNLHEKCMELPQVVISKIHWHPLTLHETFVEDDSGEYYCEHCEKTRDPRLGVYVCGQCELELPRIYHIECVLPELAKVNAKKKSLSSSVLEKLNHRIANKKEEVRSIEEKLEEATQQLEELVIQRQRKLDEDFWNISSSEDES